MEVKGVNKCERFIDVSTVLGEALSIFSGVVFLNTSGGYLTAEKIKMRAEVIKYECKNK